MYYGYIVNTSVSEDAPFLWTTKVLTNNGVQYNASTGTFTIVIPGWYEIKFNASLSGDAGDIIPTLVKDGVDSTYALATVSSTSATDFEDGSFHDIIKVQFAPSGNATLQVVNKGIDATVVSANFSIKRIG